MRLVLITDRFAERLSEVSRQRPDPIEAVKTVYRVADQVAAERAPTWADDHQLHGVYADFRSFKPFVDERDLMVLYSARSRSIVLADIGRHARFFTKGRKTKAISAEHLKPKKPS